MQETVVKSRTLKALTQSLGQKNYDMIGLYGTHDYAPYKRAPNYKMLSHFSSFFSEFDTV